MSEQNNYDESLKDSQVVVQSLTKIKNMYETLCDKVDMTDFMNIIKILPAILELQFQKSNVYGRSYCRHGWLSIFFNTERKWDRILNIMEKAIATGNVNNLYKDNPGTATETFFDTIVDLTSYSLLWVGYVYENHPEIFEQFVETNKLSK